MLLVLVRTILNTLNDGKGDPVKFFHFPGAVRQSMRRQKLIQAPHHGDSFVCTKDSYICSLQFVSVKISGVERTTQLLRFMAFVH